MIVVDTLVVLRGISKLIGDTYCLTAFIKVFLFLIKRKIDANIDKGKQSLSFLNKFAVAYTLV